MRGLGWIPLLLACSAPTSNVAASGAPSEPPANGAPPAADRAAAPPEIPPAPALGAALPPGIALYLGQGGTFLLQGRLGEGSGLPEASLEGWDAVSGELTVQERVRLPAGEAEKGVEGALTLARERGAQPLVNAGVDSARPTKLLRCADAPEGVRCGERRVEVFPVPLEQGDCPWAPEGARVRVDGRELPTRPPAPCARHPQPAALASGPDGRVAVLLAWEVPGHEGGARRFGVAAGALPAER